MHGNVLSNGMCIANIKALSQLVWEL